VNPKDIQVDTAGSQNVVLSNIVIGARGENNPELENFEELASKLFKSPKIEE
jgi:hypothetical protein